MSDQLEKQWMEDFIIEFKTNPYFANQLHNLKISEEHPLEFKEQAVQSRWLCYLAARKRAQGEIEEYRLNAIGKMNLEIAHENSELKDEIQKLKEENELLKLNSQPLFSRRDLEDKVKKLDKLLEQAIDIIKNSKPDLVACQIMREYEALCGKST